MLYDFYEYLSIKIPEGTISKIHLINREKKSIYWVLIQPIIKHIYFIIQLRFRFHFSLPLHTQKFKGNDL